MLESQHKTMKNLIKNLVFKVLVFLAKTRLKRMKNYKVIGITGSMGKTSAKDAIAHVLSSQFSVIATKKSYNSEFGVPLTILQADAGFSSAILWIKTLAKCIRSAFFSNTEVDFFVLEMGVDKKGDMDQLLSIVKPDIGVFLSVKPAHLAEGQFSNIDEIFEEKSKLIRHIKKGGIALLNSDDDRVKKSRTEEIKIINFGINPDCKLKAENIKSEISGVHFDVVYGNIKIEINSPVIGKQHIYAMLPAIYCGLEAGMFPAEVKKSIEQYMLPPGRMNLIEGINGSLIIDSSYNASPAATKSALETLYEISGEKRKIFVFGNMNELGKSSEDLHKEVGAFCGKIDLMITVGEYAKIAGEEAKKIGVKVHNFETPETASEFLKPHITSNDILLVKGSQNKVRLERLTKSLMKYPERAEKLLPRQEKQWQKII